MSLTNALIFLLLLHYLSHVVIDLLPVMRALAHLAHQVVDYDFSNLEDKLGALLF